MPRPTNTDSIFKKNEQVVGRPATTDHDINDEYFRKPPSNHTEGNALDIKGRQYLSRDDMKREERESKSSTTAPTRITKTDELAESVSEDDALHRRTTFQDVEEI
ncbi:hypothetical protein JR316_0011129 [Psilocybe cubensis]|uniref:Uncharacterized protein n=2 Tax=Psilocybe cubensis TaxID=181762 RepID=A0A8H7XME8_PSICU|nr:hypothetical protein JR316_0011129 [Psilocybe cubensis]KAH9477210.1 hypothetical protein JR316_0011129 [Psilocybe cubensis]